MSRVISEGFELGQLYGRWKNLHSGATISGTYKRSGAYALKNDPTSTQAIYTTTPYDPDATFYYQSSVEVYTRACFRIYTGSASFNGFYIGAKSKLDPFVSWCYLQIQIGQPILLRRSAGTMVTGTTTVAYGTWYMVEVHYKWDTTNGIAEMKVDGYQEGSTYNGDTTTNYFVEEWCPTVNAIGIAGNSTNTTYWDDIAMNFPDGSGKNDSWCGDGKIVALTPNGNGDSSQWVGSDGNSTDNYLLIDDSIPNTSDYVQAVTSGYKDLYNVSDWVDVGNMAVRNLWIEGYGKNLSADGLLTNLGLKTYSTEYWSEPQYLSHDWSVAVTSGYAKNPDTLGEWNTTELDALQVGVRVAE